MEATTAGISSMSAGAWKQWTRDHKQLLFLLRWFDEHSLHRFCLIASLAAANQAVDVYQMELKEAGRGQEAGDEPKSAGNPKGLTSPGKRKLRRIIN